MKRWIIALIVGHVAGSYSIAFVQLVMVPDGQSIAPNGSALVWGLMAPFRELPQLIVEAVRNPADSTSLGAVALYIAGFVLVGGFAALCVRTKPRAAPPASPPPSL